jgi:hypothetical protein
MTVVHSISFSQERETSKQRKRVRGIEEERDIENHRKQKETKRE